MSKSAYGINKKLIEHERRMRGLLEEIERDLVTPLVEKSLELLNAHYARTSETSAQPNDTGGVNTAEEDTK